MNSLSRPTPFSLAFPDRTFGDRVLAAIAAEATAREIDLADPSHFLQLGEVGLALQEMQGGGRGSEEIQGLGALLFQLYHFKNAGEIVVVLEKEEAKRIVDSQASRGEWRWQGDLPATAGYVQLPRHLFWSATHSAPTPPASASPSSGDLDASGELPIPSGSAESIDGIFWTATVAETLSLAAISGVIEGRPGFTIFELPRVPLADAHQWPELRARTEGEDFASTLPGGELSGLHSIVSLGEVLKLLSRTFALKGRQ